MTDTVTVRLVNMWFAPTSVWEKNKLQQLSGRRFKPGIYTWPKAVLAFLPSSAIVDEQETPAENPFSDDAVPDGYGGMVDGSTEKPLQADDYLREGAELASEMVTKAEETLAKRRASAQKARDAKNAKAEAKKAEVAKPEEEIPF